jgi:hypothetical protein
MIQDANLSGDARHQLREILAYASGHADDGVRLIVEEVHEKLEDPPALLFGQEAGQVVVEDDDHPSGSTGEQVGDDREDADVVLRGKQALRGMATQVACQTPDEAQI